MYAGTTGAERANSGKGDPVAAFFELRDYRIKDGQWDRRAKWMEDEVIPFQIERGMTIIRS